MNSSYNDTSNEHLTVASLFQNVLLALVCLVGVLGNTLVMIVVFRFSKMQTVINTYILNLAISNLFSLIGIPFYLVTVISGHWIFGYVTCKGYLIVTVLSQYCSAMFLCFMTVDRYIAVCHPITCPKLRTPLISRIVSLFAWTFSILQIMPIIRNSTEVSQSDLDERMSCIIDWSSQESTTEWNLQDESLQNYSNYSGFEENAALAQTSAINFTIYSFVFVYALPVCLILVLGVPIVKKMKSEEPQAKTTMKCREKSRSHRKVTILVLTVGVVYIVSSLPYWVIQLVQISSIGPFPKFLIMLHLLASSLTYLDYAMNPILYAILSDNFKKSFAKACTCASGREVNPTIHLEESVFQRKNQTGNERNVCYSRCTTQYDENEGKLQEN